MSDSSDGLVWHYTSLSALQMILGSHTLLATEVGFQNDPADSRFAEKRLEEALQRAERNGVAHARSLLDTLADLESFSAWSGLQTVVNLLSKSRFVLCASEDGDSMFCWRTYATVGDVGCAIGLDPAIGLGLAGDTGAEVIQWNPVTYCGVDDAPEIDDKILELSTSISKAEEDPDYHLRPNAVLDGAFDLQNLALGTEKANSYADEKELRVTVTKPNLQSILFGQGREGPRPRVALSAAEAPGWLEETDGGYRLPIREVRLSPTAGNGSRQSLEWLLCINGYDTAGSLNEVEMSNESGDDYTDYHLNRSDSVKILTSRHNFRDV